MDHGMLLRDGKVPGDIGDGVVALDRLALGDERVLIHALVLVASRAGAADRVFRLEFIHQTGHRGGEGRILRAGALGRVVNGDDQRRAVDLDDLGRLDRAVEFARRADEHRERTGIRERRRLRRPGPAAVRAVFDDGVVGIVRRNVLQAVRAAVIDLAVAGRVERDQIAPVHGHEDDQASVGVGRGAGGEGKDLVRGPARGFIKIVDRAAAGRRLQEREHAVLPISDVVDRALVGVGIDDGEDREIVDAAVGHDDASPVRGDVIAVAVSVERAEHGAVVHVVTVDHIIAVGHIAAVGGGQVDRAGQADLAVHVMGGVVEIVSALHDGIVDVRAVHGQPGPIVPVDGGQAARKRRGSVVDDVGPVLQQLPAVAGIDLRVGRVVQHIAGIEDQAGSQEPGQQRHELVADAAHMREHGFDRLFRRRGMRDRIVQLIHMPDLLS